MISFFKNIKFWLPLAIVVSVFLAAEGLLRQGIWDHKVEPLSYLGNSIYRKKAINTLGTENINWISVGNSVTDWGINHKKLTKNLKLKNVTYARLSMGSSKFPTIQMISDWSVSTMPELDGVMIGLHSSMFRLYQIENQLKLSWPFLDFFDNSTYQYNSDISKIDLLIKKSALSIYIDDIKNNLFNFFNPKRSNSKYIDPEKILNFNKPLKGNLCNYQLQNLKQCVDTSKNLIKKSKLTPTDKSIIQRCPANTPNKTIKANGFGKRLSKAKAKSITDNWSLFINNLSQKVPSVKLILLPEHPLLSYTSLPENTTAVYNEILNNVIINKNIEIIDLRKMAINHSTYESCEFFLDGLHLSKTGNKELTKALSNLF